MQHDWEKYFDTDSDYWNKVQKIYNENETFPKVVVSGRNLHHKFLRSFSKKEKEPIDNDLDNLVSLDLADHYLVHYYLWKCTRKGWRTFTARAFTMMNKTAQKYITDETVELLAQEYKKALKDIKCSKETKKKMAEVRKGKKRSDEAIRKTAEANRGKKRSDESRRKMAEAKKCNNWNKGKAHSEEHKRKIAESRKGKAQSEETKRKISEAKKGKHWKLVDGKRVYY